MLTFKEFTTEDVASINKKLSRVDALNIAAQRAAATKKHHYAVEHPDGWKIHDEEPKSSFSTNRIIRVDRRGNRKNV